MLVGDVCVYECIAEELASLPHVYDVVDKTSDCHRIGHPEKGNKGGSDFFLEVNRANQLKKDAAVVSIGVKMRTSPSIDPFTLVAVVLCHPSCPAAQPS